MKEIDFGTGRIGEIISGLQKAYSVEDVTTLPEIIKLTALTSSLQLSTSEFDALIAENSPVFRTVKGHAFESVFKFIVENNNQSVTQVGGDDVVDLEVNGVTLQLKTPNMAGTNAINVQYKTHKTHGAKSEQESMDYYHDINHFADYLVGLISYDPINFLFLNHEEIPRHSKDNSKILSPFTLEWNQHDGLNSFDRIGINNIDLTSQEHIPSNIDIECLPKSSSKLNLKSEIILDTILTDGNFRIWDMSIRGFAREVAIDNLLSTYGVKSLNPVPLKKERGDKADFAVNKQGNYVFFQVKGVSTNNCKFNGKDSVVATETQLTRGRVNDHPTQSRLYLKADFEYLILALDPPLVQLYFDQIGVASKLEWKIFCIPTNELTEHAKITHRLNSLQKIKFTDLLKYEVTEDLVKSVFM